MQPLDRHIANSKLRAMSTKPNNKVISPSNRNAPDKEEYARRYNAEAYNAYFNPRTASNSPGRAVFAAPSPKNAAAAAAAHAQGKEQRGRALGSSGAAKRVESQAVHHYHHHHHHHYHENSLPERFARNTLHVTTKISLQVKMGDSNEEVRKKEGETGNTNTLAHALG